TSQLPHTGALPKAKEVTPLSMATKPLPLLPSSMPLPCRSTSQLPHTGALPKAKEVTPLSKTAQLVPAGVQLYPAGAHFRTPGVLRSQMVSVSLPLPKANLITPVPFSTQPGPEFAFRTPLVFRSQRISLKTNDVTPVSMTCQAPALYSERLP